MKTILGSRPSSPRSQLLEEPNPSQDVPIESAGSKRTSAQADLPGAQAAQSKQLRGSPHGMSSNRAGALQRQLLDQLNAKSALAAPAGSKRTGTQAYLQAPSLGKAAAAAAVAAPDLAMPAIGQLPTEPHWGQDDDLDQLLQMAELNLEQNEQALQALMAEDLVHKADEVDAVRPGPQQALRDYGFGSENVGRISKRPLLLRYLAQKYPQLRESLPDLTPSDFTAVAMRRAGELALEALLEVANDLKEEPLGLSDQQLAGVAKRGERPALLALPSLGKELIADPYCLTSNQVVAIASNNGGAQALAAVKALLPDLVDEPYKLNTEQVVAIASHEGGAQALAAVKALLPDLVDERYELTSKEVVAIASHTGGAQALGLLNELLPDLLNEPYKLTSKQVVAIASMHCGAQALGAVQQLLPDLVSEPYSLTTNQVVAIASRRGGVQALEAVMAYLPKLLDTPYKMKREDVVDIANRRDGKQRLEDIIRQVAAR